MLAKRRPAEVGVQEHTGSVDDRGIRRVGFGAERVEDLCFERPGCLVERGWGYLTGTKASAEPVDRRAARLHDGGMAMIGDRVLQGWEIEQAMNRRDVPIVWCHERYSIAATGGAVEPRASGRNGWS